MLKQNKLEAPNKAVMLHYSKILEELEESLEQLKEEADFYEKTIATFYGASDKLWILKGISREKILIVVQRLKNIEERLEKYLDKLKNLRYDQEE